MPQLPSSKKRLRQARKRTIRNRNRKQAMKEATQHAVDIAESGDEEQVQEAIRAAQKAIDKAAKTGAIHKGAAARRKSRLMKRINSIKQEA